VVRSPGISPDASKAKRKATAPAKAAPAKKKPSVAKKTSKR